MTCRQPDRDNPKLLCGYPLPCPWHTALIRADKDPPTVEIPVTAKHALDSRKELAEIAECLKKALEEDQCP